MQFFANMPPHGGNVTASTVDTSSSSLKDSCETQTEIVAVHTPQVEQLPAFPFKTASASSKLTRPSTLPISSSETSPKITSQDGKPIIEEEEVGPKEDDLVEEVVVEIEADPGDTEENDDGEQKELDEKEFEDTGTLVKAVN